MTARHDGQADGLPGMPPPVTEAELRALHHRLAGQAEAASSSVPTGVSAVR